MHDNRRAIYRVNPDPRESLEVALVHHHAVVPAEQIIDVSMGGVGSQFPADSCPRLAVGDRVKLNIRSVHHPVPLDVQARVTFSADEGPYRRLGFEFDSMRQWGGELPGMLCSLFNRRGVRRISFGHVDEPVQVGILVPGAPKPSLLATGRLDNLSTTGLGMVTDAAAEDFLEGMRDIGLELRLPELERPARIMGTIQNTIIDNGLVYYGVSFDTRDPAYLELAEDILDLVLDDETESPLH